MEITKIIRAVRQHFVDWMTMETYQTTVEKQFKQSWRHKTTCPEIKAVYKIIVTEASMNQYQEYMYERSPVMSNPASITEILIVVMTWKPGEIS